MTLQRAVDAVGTMASIVGDANFSAAFYDILDDLIGVDHCTAFISTDNGVRTLVAAAQSPKAAQRVQTLAASYTSGAYRVDPVWNAHAAAGCCQPVTSLLAPSQFRDDAYRREFYETPNIMQELATSANVAGARVYASVYREQGRARFSNDDLGLLASCGRAAVQVLVKHAALSGNSTARPAPEPLGRDALFARVHRAIQADNGLLTRREAEICAGIVMGYTVVGLGLNLGISINTVATHRKRAYAKLNISSQNELFAHYFWMVERHSG